MDRDMDRGKGSNNDRMRQRVAWPLFLVAASLFRASLSPSLVPACTFLVHVLPRFRAKIDAKMKTTWTSEISTVVDHICHLVAAVDCCSKVVAPLGLV